MKKHFLVPVLFTLSLSSIADASTNNPKNVNKLDDVVVTATRTAISADDSIVPVVVIDSEDIARSPAKDIVSLLSGTAGINISNTGGLGKQSSIFIRGANSNQVVVLIDGVRVGSATLGSTALEHIPLEQIDRIELVKGPRSSLYGSDAIGGVLQIFTKKGDDAKAGFSPSITIGTGTDKTHKMNVAVSGGMDGFSLSMVGTFLNSNGDDATLKDNAINNPDADGYSNDSVSFNIGKLWDNGVKLDLMLMQATSKSEYDSLYSQFAHSLQKNDVRSVKVIIPVGYKVDASIQVGESIDEYSNYSNGVQTYLIESKRRSQSLQLDYQLTNDFVITGGFDYQQDRVSPETSYQENNTRNESRFLQGQFAIGVINMLAGYRHDDFEKYGDQDTWNIGAKIQPFQSLSFTAGFGTAFKLPTINDLYSSYGGNPDLLPEKSKTTDIGVAWKTKAIKLGLDLYKTEVENIIVWREVALYTWNPFNLNKAKIKGAEFTLDMNMKAVNILVGLGYLNAKDVMTGNRLMRRPNKSAKVRVSKHIGRFDLAADFIAYGSSFDDSENTIKNGGYGKFGSVVRYDLNKQVSFTLRGDNLFDKEYSTASGYTSPGRNFMLEMKAGF